MKIFRTISLVTITIIMLIGLSFSAYSLTSGFNHKKELQAVNQDNATLEETITNNSLDQLNERVRDQELRVEDLNQVLELRNQNFDELISEIRSQLSMNREKRLNVDVYLAKLRNTQDMIADPNVNAISYQSALDDFNEVLDGLRKDYNNHNVLDSRLAEQQDDFDRQLDEANTRNKRLQDRLEREIEKSERLERRLTDLEREDARGNDSAPPRESNEGD